MISFVFEDKYNKYAAEIEGTVVCCQEVNKSNYEYAEKIVQLYHQKLNDIMEFIWDDIKDIYVNATFEKLPVLLGKPVIDIDINLISYFEQQLDSYHIIEVEYADDFNKLLGVSIDG